MAYAEEMVRKLETEDAKAQLRYLYGAGESLLKRQQDLADPRERVGADSDRPEFRQVPRDAWNPAHLAINLPSPQCLQ